MNDYQTIITEAVSLAQQSADEAATAEAVVPWDDGAEISLSKNLAGGFLTVGVTLGEVEPTEALLEQVLQIGSLTTYGDLVIGSCSPDRRLTLSAILPLAGVTAPEVDRRVSQLLSTAISLKDTSSPSDEAPATETESPPAAWMKI